MLFSGSFGLQLGMHFKFHGSFKLHHFQQAQRGLRDVTIAVVMVEGTTITGVLTTVGMAAVLVAAVSPSAMVRVHSIHMQWCVIIQFTWNGA